MPIRHHISLPIFVVVCVALLTNGDRWLLLASHFIMWVFFLWVFFLTGTNSFCLLFGQSSYLQSDLVSVWQTLLADSWGDTSIGHIVSLFKFSLRLGDTFEEFSLRLGDTFVLLLDTSTRHIVSLLRLRDTFVEGNIVRDVSNLNPSPCTGKHNPHTPLEKYTKLVYIQ